ncbi:Uncharacterized protein OBRU01_14950 [Operophtera brumata]|uniref:Tick transposon n=1 Tax=Operophtera brumata TaxID=104452 RepID=A0A0L7L5N6_OPEBR|nr:Uncharacterized protein OBRU01_14950 [Operophtera brumata]
MQKYKLDIRKQWECIKDLCYMNKTKTVSHELLNLKVSAEESINNVIHYFSNIGSQLARNILERNNESFEMMPSVGVVNTSTSLNSFVLLATDENEVKEIIRSLKDSKSTGIRTDGQPPPSTIQIISHHCKQAQNCSCLEVLPATEIKYLGVLLDNQLRWKPNIKSLSGRIRKLIYVFKTLRHVCDPSQLVSVYYALGQSIITYCISSWGGCPKSTLITLERAQRAVLKVLSFKPYRYPTIELYKETSVLTVRQCFIKTILLEQHKIPMPKNQHVRRQDLVYIKPLCKTTFAQNFADFLGPFIYNRISKHCELRTKLAFNCRKAITEYLKTMSYDAIESFMRP